MTLVVGFCVFEDEAVGPLQAVRTLVHAVWAVFEVEAFHTVVGTLGERGGEETLGAIGREQKKERKQRKKERKNERKKERKKKERE